MEVVDRFKIRFRRRPSAVPTTRQGIVDAIAAGVASGSGPYVIGLAGTIDFGGADMAVSGRHKGGEPIVVKSISRLAPVVIRGIAGHGFSFSQCSSIVLDQIVQDGWRLFRRNGNVLIEGEYGHDPVIYHALAISGIKPNHHPDGSQISTGLPDGWTRPAGARMGGDRNIRRMLGRSCGAGGAIYHGDGYWGGEACRLHDPQLGDPRPDPPSAGQ
ncbi:hypothetical protein CNY89_08565 [Amaricoccus sp. HAR-UPW-R2A-40]|nr:hypothetical protein CNY89_08565 [Amaricoccus sp. HAR-UPW-R2A-40]